MVIIIKRDNDGVVSTLITFSHLGNNHEKNPIDLPGILCRERIILVQDEESRGSGTGEEAKRFTWSTGGGGSLIWGEG